MEEDLPQSTQRKKDKEHKGFAKIGFFIIEEGLPQRALRKTQGTQG